MIKKFKQMDTFEKTVVLTIIFIILLVLMLILSSIIYTIAAYNNTNTYIVTIEDKVVKSDGGDSQKYLIFTKTSNGEERVFENTDALFAGKFDSSDYYAKIKIGKTYKFKTIGFRIPFLSEYENIIEFEEVKWK